MSKGWLRENRQDPYIKKAKTEGYPARSAYKLLELDKKDHLFKLGMAVIDLGAAPGSWSIVAQKCVGETGLVIAIDLKPTTVPEPIISILGDCGNAEVMYHVAQRLKEHHRSKVDVILSDMAPNLSGIKDVDRANSDHLLDFAWEYVKKFLKPNGTVLIKLFQGEEIEAWRKQLGLYFKRVRYRKPAASRSRSSEVYILGSEFLGYNDK